MTVNQLSSTYEPYYVKEVLESSSRNLFSVVSLFAGGGGSSTGYRLAGGKVLAINEFVDEAVRTYTENFKDTVIIPGDVKNLDEKTFWEVTGLAPGELDILDGSPPCSAFSVAGKREKGWKDAVKHESSDRNKLGDLVSKTTTSTVKSGQKLYSDGKKVEAIEDLFLEFIRIANFVQPKVIIAENVKGITFGEARKKLFEFINAFADLGYQVTYKVLSAADYGVPQARERTIFICVRNDVAKVLGLNPMMLPRLFPKPTSKHISLRSAIDDVVSDPAQEQELYDYVQNGFQKKWIEMLPFNPTRHMKPSDPEFISINPKRSLFNMIRPNPDLPSPTITQRGNQKSVSGVFHYAKNRKFTIPELKRIMGLPEDFKLTGDFDKQAERIGRMVAPKMMAEIAKSVHEKVLKPYKEKTKND